MHKHRWYRAHHKYLGARYCSCGATRCFNKVLVRAFAHGYRWVRCPSASVGPDYDYCEECYKAARGA